MPAPEHLNAEQLAFWNGPGGARWVVRQEHTDAVLAPVSDALLALAAPRAGERVLDVGCAKRCPRISTEQACACALQSGWSAARLPECARTSEFPLHHQHSSAGEGRNRDSLGRCGTQVHSKRERQFCLAFIR